MNNPYNLLIALSILVVLSYLFNMVSGKLRIPSVILLLATGVLLNYAGKELGYAVPGTKFLLELLGIVGLIFIVMEGALDLKITRKRLPLIGKSILSALSILVVTSGIISYIFIEMLLLPMRTAIVYSIPLGVISSAIAIPSAGSLSTEKKEFIIYESTFSDICGIMIFNYVILDNLLTGASIGNFFLDLLIIIVLSVGSTIFMLFLLNYTRSTIKFFLIFSILILVYSVSKMFHLPSLILILIFGMMLNNANLYIRGRLARYLHLERLEPVTHELKLITAETAFIVRTFFFLLFGYSIDLMMLMDWRVLFSGSLIMATIILTRYVFLRFISRSNLYPALFVAPRGLITIVLFYSIPVHLQNKNFNEGILLFVIIASSLIMMLGLMMKENPVTEIRSLDKISESPPVSSESSSDQ